MYTEGSGTRGGFSSLWTHEQSQFGPFGNIWRPYTSLVPKSVMVECLESTLGLMDRLSGRGAGSWCNLLDGRSVADSRGRCLVDMADTKTSKISQSPLHSTIKYGKHYKAVKELQRKNEPARLSWLSLQRSSSSIAETSILSPGFGRRKPPSEWQYRGCKMRSLSTCLHIY